MAGDARNTRMKLVHYMSAVRNSLPLSVARHDIRR